MNNNMSDDSAKDGAEQARELADYAAAKSAADAADILANYLQWKRPDLEESIASIRGLGEAIRRSLPSMTQKEEPA